MNRDYNRKKNSIFHPAVISLMVISTLLNILLSMVARTTELPFYIDTVGTIVATALGGVVPGILTAFVTNAVNFFMDGESIFYASLNMLIAIVSAAFFGDYSKYRKLKKKEKQKDKNKDKESYLYHRFVDGFFFVLVLGLIGGGIGAAITWFLYRSPSDSPMVVAISGFLSNTFGIGVFGCHMISTYITDVMDKAISLCIALSLIVLTPKKIKEMVRLSPWRQKSMSFDEREISRKKLRGRFSIGARINVIIIVSVVFMTVIAEVFSVVSFRNSKIESMSRSAEQIAFLAAKEISPGMVDDYLETGYLTPGYVITRDNLTVLKNSSSDIAFLYVYKIERDGCHVVFDLDTTLSDGSFVKGDSPGTVVGFEEALKPYVSDLLEGKEIPAVIMDDDYGSFIAAYYPVYDSEGKCVCYAVSNVEYKIINSLLLDYFGKVFLLFTGFLILIVAISILTTRYHVVMPIRSMTLYANELTGSREGASEESLEKIEELDIHTNDEVELLYRALCKLTGDTVYRLNDNKHKTEAISKMQNVLIITMADMVESRDSDTGAHVLKTSEYVRIILQGLKRNGYYAEKITDKYMRDVEMSAPLHDVGKINIPDAILNKPGKLTKEEFEIMKTHTTAGKHILENAISSMEGENYLKEARNMAAYHHERWDGNGYPEGLHGEVIPLSARIMAIADVFDALSSPRIYKPAFPFDEAVNMIKEGAGTQFDPKCVEVFMESLAEVRKVHKKYQEK